MHQSTQSKTSERRAYRVKEAAEAFRLGRSTIYSMLKSGRLRSVKIGGSRLIPRDALEALLAEGGGE